MKTFIILLILFIIIFLISATDKKRLNNISLLASTIYSIFCNKFLILIKKLITLYLSFLFFVRAFFLKERPYIIPFIILAFSVNLYYPFLPFTTTIYSQMFSLIYTGLYLIGIDSICSYVSKKIIDNIPGFWDGLAIFFREKNDNIFLDYYRATGLSAIIIGKTAMTATGRAALGAAIIGGAFLVTNTYLQGQQTATEGQKNRDFQAQQAQKNRDFQNHQAQKNHDFQAQQFHKQQEWNAYNSSWNPFKKPPSS